MGLILIDCIIFFVLGVLALLIYQPKHPWVTSIGPVIVLCGYLGVMYVLFFQEMDLDVYIEIHVIPALLVVFLRKTIFRYKFGGE